MNSLEPHRNLEWDAQKVSEVKTAIADEGRMTLHDDSLE